MKRVRTLPPPEVSPHPPRARGARRRGLIALVAALALLGSATDRAAPPSASAPPDLSWIDREALDDGEIIVRTDRRGPAIGVEAAALVHAPAETVWSVVTACERTPEYVPDIVSCKSLERLDGGRAELFEQTVDAPFFMPRFDHVFRLDYDPYRRIDVHGVRGPLKRLEGSWWLLPEPAGVLLVHEIEVEPDIPVPRLFVRIGIKRDLTKTIAAMRDRAEAAAKAEQAAAAP